MKIRYSSPNKLLVEVLGEKKLLSITRLKVKSSKTRIRVKKFKSAFPPF